LHTKHIVTFGGVACILAMLAYLFVFADAPLAPAGQLSVDPPAAGAP
jgi:hypothetical protein